MKQKNQRPRPGRKALHRAARRHMAHRALALLLSVLMLAAAAPPPAFAAGKADPQPETQAEVSAADPAGYSFAAAEEGFAEDAGRTFLTVTRTENLNEAETIEVVAYDLSASYGEDYVLLENGSAVQRLDDGRSLFDAFREDGQLAGLEETDLSILAGTLEMMETGSSPEELAGSESEDYSDSPLEILDRVGARVAVTKLRFAAGQASAPVELEILDDGEPEYSETFMLGILGGNSVSVSIRDNEPVPPSAAVSFEKALADEDNNGQAEVYLTRTGDLATMSTVLVSQDGVPYGYVAFNPWQDRQMVRLSRGGYSLSEPTGCVLGSTSTVTVQANPVATAIQTVSATQALMNANELRAAPSDPELDAIPTYSALPSEISGAAKQALRAAYPANSKVSVKTEPNPDWMSGWAMPKSTTGSFNNYPTTEDKDSFVIVPTIVNEWLTDASGNLKSVESVKNYLFFYDSYLSSGDNNHVSYGTQHNEILTNTAGKWDSTKKSTLTVETTMLDLQGMQSATMNFASNGKDTVKIKAGYYIDGKTALTDGTDYKKDGFAKREITTPDFPCIMDGEGVRNGKNGVEIRFQNIDPSNSATGTKVYLANAIKFNKRPYLIHLVGSEPLTYTDGEQKITFDGNNNDFVMTAWMNPLADGNGDSHIPLIYQTEGDYQMEVMSYRLVSAKDPTKKSGWNSIQRDKNKTPYISFDRDFLKYYEDGYVYATKHNGQDICAFNIELRMMKVPVEYTIVPSNLGALTLENTNGELYKGDTAVFTGKAADQGGSFNGVFVKARSASNNEWKTYTVYADADGRVRVHMDKHNDVYEFEGVYSAGADTLVVNYAEGAGKRGQLPGGEGVVVSKADYVKNRYIPLSAKPNSGYVTQWTDRNGNRYYGDIFYYQLDGNPDHNTFTVDFIKPSLTTTDVTGTMSLTDANMKVSSRSDTKRLANAQWTVTSSTGTAYTGWTDDNGRYTVKGFKGVSGGVYSMEVLHDGTFSYFNFTLGSSGSYSPTLSQFTPGSFFPDDVTIHLNSSGVDSTIVQLRPEDYIEVTVKVCNPSRSVYDVDKVELAFMNTDTQGGQALAYTGEALLDPKLTEYGDNGGSMYSYYTVNIACTELPANTQLWLDVVGSTRLETGVEAEVRSGRVNSGYTFQNQTKDISLPVQEYPPAVPGAASAESVDLSDLDIPLIGVLDFSVGTRDGAFFVRAQDPNDPSVYTLTAGYSIHPTFGLSNTKDRMDNAKKDLDQMYGAKDSGAKALGDTSGVTSNTLVDGSGMKSGSGTDKTSNMKDIAKKTKIYITPAVYMKLSFKTNPGTQITELIGYDVVVGMDARVTGNYPFNIEGVPFFINVSFAGEAYVEAQGKFPEGSADSIPADSTDKGSAMYDNSRTNDQWYVNFNIPTFNLTLKGGVGLNNLLSFFVDGTIGVKLGLELVPKVDAGGSLSAKIGAGADVLMFAPELSVNIPTLEFGSDEVRDQIWQISSSGKSAVAEEPAAALENFERSLTEEFTDSLQNAVFKPAARTVPFMQLGQRTISNGVLLDNAFKAGKVKLTQLDGGVLMATMLADNGVDEGSYNFLSGVYALSTDGGSTWTAPQTIAESKDLQFDVNVFQLDEKMLVTWSEGDLDEALAGCDRDNLKAPQIAKALNAMNLKGRYFNKATGQPEGEAFLIAADSNVAFSMLEAYESGDKVYCYYNRAQYPTADQTTLTDLLDREITIACAVMEGSQVVVTDPIRVQNPDGSETYRITEVVPFNYKGVLGEAIVIDQDGDLVTRDAAGNVTGPSNLDRQVFLRFYTLEDGKFTSSQLFPVSDPALCAQHVQVAQNGEHIALLWNQGGEIVYLNDFLSIEGEDCYVVDPDTGVVTAHKHEIDEDGEAIEVSYNVDAQSAAAHSSLNVDRAFAASMSKDGDVLVSWIADREDAVSSDEVYGIMLKAGVQKDVDDVEETEYEHRVLTPVGKPVALTDENAPLNRLDSVCLSDDSFLIAYAKLNGATRSESDRAQIKAVRSTYEPDLRVTDIATTDFPMPGSNMDVQVTVENRGLKTLDGVKLTASGVGETATVTDNSPVLPGDTKTFTMTVAVPEDFHESTDLNVTVSGLDSQSAYTASVSDRVLYEAYFVPEEMARLYNIPNTRDYEAWLTVKNIGNASGIPNISYVSYIPGQDPDGETSRSHSFTASEELAPGGIMSYIHRLEDTPAGNGDSIRVHVSLGDGHDQNVEGYAPDPVLRDDDDDDDTGKPDDRPLPFVDVAENAWYAPAVRAVYINGFMAGVDATHFAPNSVTSRAMVAQVLYNMEGRPKNRVRMSFTDVPANAWYADAVSWAAQNGLINGCGGGKFKPNAPATREQTAAMLKRYAKWKGMKEKTSNVTLSNFPDGKAVSGWAKDSMLWAVKQGVIKGKSGKLVPQGTTSRAELAQMLLNLTK